jgi:translation initiation factor 1A
MLGNGRLEAQCFDGEKRLAHIRGKMRKKVWINQGDIILISLREFQDEKADVIVKYTVEEVSSQRRGTGRMADDGDALGPKPEAVR